MVYNGNVKFGEWLTRKYTEWRGQRIGNSASVKEFAKLFGASQQLVSDWLNGVKVPTSPKYINTLVDHYGDEVYEVLGLPDPLADLPEDIRDLVRSINRELLEQGVTSTSPDAKRITDEILAKYGFSRISKKDVPSE